MSVSRKTNTLQAVTALSIWFSSLTIWIQIILVVKL